MEEIVVDLIFYLFQKAYEGISSLVSGWSSSSSEPKQNQKKSKKSNKNKNKNKKQYSYDRSEDDQEVKFSNNEDKSKSLSAGSVEQSSWKNSWFLFFFVTINQGFVGTYTNFGILSQSLLQPGLHFYIPYYQKVTQINISPQTTKIQNVLCGTLSGLTVTIQNIQIVSQLQKGHVYSTVKEYSTDYRDLFISSNARHKMGELCSKYSLEDIYIKRFDKLDEDLATILRKDLSKWIPGLKIVDIRITKPILPASISRIYEQVQKIKGKYHLTVEKQKLHTEKIKSINHAESQLEVRIIQLRKEVQKKQNEYKLQQIQTSIQKQSNITQINNDYMLIEKQVEAQQSKFTHKFMASHVQNSINNGLFLVGDHQPIIDTTL